MRRRDRERRYLRGHDPEDGRTAFDIRNLELAAPAQSYKRWKFKTAKGLEISEQSAEFPIWYVPCQDILEYL